MPSDSGASWSPPAGSGERRLSNSSDGSAGSGYSKALPSDTSDYLQLRAKAPGAKPAANPLQFVKVGPCELYRSAQEQLKRAEKVKQNKEVKKEELEDWQSNLDNWKSSRRKRVEHIIERCVEVKRMENEPAPGSRAKSKTFNEMLEERVGKRRRCPLALYPEEETTDLSDLGIGTSSTKSSLSEDCDTHSLASDGIDLDKNHSDVDNLSNCGSGNRKLGSSANEYDTCTTTTISSPEPEEYTYEGAIEGYKSRMSSDYKNYGFTKDKTPDKVSNGDINRIKTTVSNKIEEGVTSLQNKPELKPNQKKDLPKVDILKRREKFEKENSLDVKSKLPEISNKISIKDRLSSLEKFTEEQNKSTVDLSKQIPAEVVPLKERLSSLEKLKSAASEVDKTKLRLSNGDLNNGKSVRERLSSLKSQTSEESVKLVKTEVKEVSMSIKERLSNLDAAKNIEDQKHVDLKSDTKEQESKDHSLKTSLCGLENQVHNFCRSLNSLDVNGTSSSSSFERVQSFEELETCNESHNLTRSNDKVELAESKIESDNQNFETSTHPNTSDQLINGSVDTKNNDVIEEIDDQDISKADTDSTSNYHQAVSHQDDLSAADDITEIQLDNDEDTLKSLDPQDTSVIDALELAFQEIDCDPKNEMTNENKHETEPLKAKESNLPTNETAVEVRKSGKHTGETTHVTETACQINGEAKNYSPDYENIDIFYENGGVLENVVDSGAVFPLDVSRKLLEPPKEKPPPPPVEDCAEDDVPLGNGNFKSTNSTRRIKKEIRNKRTSFLGLEDQAEDYLDISLAPRPDITSFLQEETKIERLLYKKTLSHSMDSKLRESRDSGVDLDKPSADNYKSSPETSNPHSRQNSEPFTQVTVTSDEEDSKITHTKQFSEKLTSKLEEIQDPHQTNVGIEQSKIDSLDKTLQEQQEVLRFERELLQLEQEELRRQRDNLLFRESETRRLQKSVQDVSNIPRASDRSAPPRDHRHSMPDLMINQEVDFAAYDPEQPISRQMVMRHDAQKTGYDRQLDAQKPRGDQRVDAQKLRYDADERCSSERSRLNGTECSPKRPVPRDGQHTRPAAPKPRSSESLEREMMMRSSRVPSAVEYVNIEKPVQPRPKPIINGVIPSTNGQYHPMTRNTLQALSAAPTPKLISGADWLQARSRKQIPPSYHYNSHWLIQEAEQRRIEEQRSKMRLQPAPAPLAAPAAPHRHPHHELATHSAAYKPHTLGNSTHPHSGADRPAYPPGGEMARDKDGEAMLSVSGRRKCSHCGQELGRGAAMIIESLSLCYHVCCFTCVVCGARLGDGRAGADVRVRARRLHCHQCYSSDDGTKLSCV